ncbi:spore coat protein YutH [Metabacillus sp. GX 13764]|uniref:spore coat putative kinase YutH n=1 Tax=Metabacillus kandeliae TaxID=2900151 RepID=UPI001E397538|nr:spore coat protein YutH [Metabacillus kandeliae]MCD7036256.1 spore coat protein YutH [Metabacillus kandeliae]
MRAMLKENYGLHASDFFKVNGCDAFRIHQTVCLVVPVHHLDEDELFELHYMSQYLQEKREPYTAVFQAAKDGKLYSEHQGVKYAVLKLGQAGARNSISPGRELAQFHQRGRSFPYQLTKSNRIGQWKTLWEKRLDQLEAFWRGKVQAHPLDRFEKLFIESFPYYLGLGENGIQYLVDTELDDEPKPVDSAAICHQRFSRSSWGGEVCAKLPTDWVFDHASRDIAEYMRQEFLNRPDELRESGASFIEEYDRTVPLSSFSWRLIYSRLLFPLHYFECIEDYYLSQEAQKPYYEKQLHQLLERSGEYEQFLKSYSSMLSMRTRRIVLPAVHWI